jgi:hypothetical protein
VKPRVSTIPSERPVGRGSMRLHSRSDDRSATADRPGGTLTPAGGAVNAGNARTPPRQGREGVDHGSRCTDAYNER